MCWIWKLCDWWKQICLSALIYIQKMWRNEKYNDFDFDSQPLFKMLCHIPEIWCDDTLYKKRFDGKFIINPAIFSLDTENFRLIETIHLINAFRKGQRECWKTSRGDFCFLICHNPICFVELEWLISMMSWKTL